MEAGIFRRIATLFGVTVLAAACATAPERASEEVVDPDAYGAFLAARYAAQQRDAAASAHYFRRALAREPGNQIVLERAFMSALSAGDMETATALAHETVKVENIGRLARILLAGDAVKQGHYTRARKLLEDQDLGPFNRVVGALVLAWAYSGEGNDEAALKALDAPADAPILGHLMTLHRALVLDRAGRPEEAEKLYQQALESGVLRGVVVDAYGRRLEREGRRDEAGALYAAQLIDNPVDPIAAAGLDRIRAGVRPAPIADTVAQGASLAVFGPAATLASNASSELAMVYLRLALFLDPDNGAARYLLGTVLSRLDLDAESRAVLAKLDPASPYYVAAQVSSSWSLLREERDVEAIGQLQALVTETDTEAARFALGDALRIAERFEEALGIYDRIVADLPEELEPEDWRIFYVRGICYERVEDWDHAVADFQQALALSPDEPSVLNYLGYSWVDRGENLDKAFAMIRRAVSLEPDSGYIVDSLGWAHYKLGEYAEAVRNLERAVELDPQDPTINDHLGDAYWRVGRRLEASFQWTRVLSLDPEDDQRAEIEAKLNGGLPSDESIHAGP